VEVAVQQGLQKRRQSNLACLLSLGLPLLQPFPWMEVNSEYEGHVKALWYCWYLTHAINTVTVVNQLNQSKTAGAMPK
jgi:hypothetical protein